MDGAEVCELVGVLILSKLKCEFNNKDIGLYRDDGLAVFRNMRPRSADNLRKRITKCFDTLGLKITIQSNLKIVNHLDVTFNLTNNSYYPYRKPDNPPMYINVPIQTTRHQLLSKSPTPLVNESPAYRAT